MERSSKEIDLFVPGRLCLMGEHSDWAGKYRNINHEIVKGYAIVTGIEEGIYATAKQSDKFIVQNDKEKFESEMVFQSLAKIAQEGGYWSYAAGVASLLKEQYNIGGIEVTITKVTLPIKKGLSSSAAICVLIARAFNQLYNLHLTTLGEMNLAYNGEIETPSRCGKLDQACAYGKKPILMIFDGDKLGVKNLKIEKDLHFVFADLMSKKDTIKILGDLNKAFPFADNEKEKGVQDCFGKLNKEIVLSSVKYIETGELDKLGEMMNKAQENFDKLAMPACPQELEAPVLHKVLKDEYLKSLSYGRKGVGSQGDGTVQFLAKDAESQELIKKYLDEQLHMPAFKLTLEKTSPIKKAIIPVAGNGVRMFPITKYVKKSFLPIVEPDGLIKPLILCLLEEIEAAGIEEICLVIDPDDQRDYDKLFNIKLSPEVANKLTSQMLDYESKIIRIGKKLTYVYQKEKLGLGHAVHLCREFAGNDPVLLVLGDQLYKTSNNESCTTQFLKNYAKTGKLSVSVCEVNPNDVSRYGILCGKLEHDDYFQVDAMVEKPEKSIAEEKYYTLIKGEKKYFGVFGQYILTPNIFKILQENIEQNLKEFGEYQITSALDKEREKNGMVAFIPDGKMLDCGNIQAYRNTFIEKSTK